MCQLFASSNSDQLGSDMAVSVDLKNTKPPGLGRRHCQAVMTFLAVTLAYSMRSNLSVAIVAMTSSSPSHPDFTVLQWTNSQQGIILGSFFWGYMVTGIPAGHLARRIGPKVPLCFAMFISSLITVFSPLIANNFSWVVFCASRVVNGLVQGAFYPSVNTHMAKWAPPLERGRMFGFVFGGSQFGIMLTMLVAGYLAAGPWGWPSIFYVTGGCGFLWTLVWLFLGADSPDAHPSISDQERLYITSSLVDSSEQSTTMRTPWKEIVTSVPLWALLVAHLGQNWGYWMLVTMLPSYLSHVLKFDLESNGLYSMLPYLSQYVLTLIVCFIADLINEKRLLSLNFSRKMWNTIGHWGAAAALVAISQVNSAQAVVVLLTLSVAVDAGTYVGFLCNHLDLAPNFAGFLMGITNGIANLTSILGPTITGFIVQDVTSRDQWMIAFYISAGVFFLGNLVFILLGTTDVQAWNQPPSTSYPRGKVLNLQTAAPTQC